MDCYDYTAHVFHNNERTPTYTDISTLLMTLSSLGISISTILCYSSYFGLTKSNYFCFSLAIGISFHYQFWWMDLRYLACEAGIIMTPRSLLMYLFSLGHLSLGLLSKLRLSCSSISLINIHKPCLSVYVWTSEILYYVVNIQNYKLRMLMNTPILSLTP